MSPRDHDHPVDQARVAAARADALSVGDAGRLAGLLGLLADPVRSASCSPWRPPVSCASATWPWLWT